MSTNVDQLVLAVESGDLPAVKRLALQVADVNAECSTQWTALQAAAFYGQLDVAQWLVREARADVDRAFSASGESPLCLACQEGKAGVARLPIEAGADLNATNREGATALYVCAQHDRAAAARGLIEAHANVNSAANDGTTPLYSSAQNDSTAVMRLLLAASADVEQAEEGAQRPLVQAAQNGQAASVRLLLGASANVNARGFRSCTALAQASASGRVACVRLLLRFGRADMSLRGDAPNNLLARIAICFHPQANKADAPAIHEHLIPPSAGSASERRRCATASLCARAAVNAARHTASLNPPSTC